MSISGSRNLNEVVELECESETVYEFYKKSKI